VPTPNWIMNHYQAEEYARNLSLAGGGWRLPTRAELSSINDPSKPGNADPKFNVSNSVVWTSELNGSSYAWSFYFTHGAAYVDARDGSGFRSWRVLAVRSRR
jgi:hypothetical protein